MQGNGSSHDYVPNPNLIWAQERIATPPTNRVLSGLRMGRWLPNRRSSSYQQWMHQRIRCRFPGHWISNWSGSLPGEDLTGGISFGSSTSFVIVIFPFLIGHVKSTLETCSQRSAWVLTSLINPYLTCKMTKALSSISSRNVPTASMVRVFPLVAD